MAAGTSLIEEDVLDAEIVEVLSNGSRRELNISMISTIAVSIVFLLMAMSFGKAVIYDSNQEGSFSGEWWETPLHQRHKMDLPMDLSQRPQEISIEQYISINEQIELE